MTLQRRLRPHRHLCTLLVLGGLSAGAPALAKTTAILPWITAARGPVAQSSDLYVHNPGADPMVATMTFRRRGVPDTNPPRATRTIAPDATFYAGNVMQLFHDQNVAGTVVVTTDGDVTPVVTSFTSTVKRRNKFLDHLMARQSDIAAPKDEQLLVGLRQDASVRTTLFLFNPADGAASYEVTFLALDGTVLGTLPAVHVDPGLGVELAAAQLPLPAGNRTGAFTVRVLVASGELLSSAQVVDQRTGQAADVQGVDR